MDRAFLIKYGEIGVKGKNRYLFEDALIKQIQFALKKVEGEFAVRKEQGRIFVEAVSEFDYEGTLDSLKKVFGIVGICPMVSCEYGDYDVLEQHAVLYMQEHYQNRPLTFKVNARRAKKNFPLTSMEINAKIGEKLLQTMDHLKVDVHHPDVLLNIELRERIYFYSETIPGAGGMPIGTNGRATLLLSGGIDSPVAGYMIAKRGVELDAVYFHAPPYTSDRAKQKVVDLARLVSEYAGEIHLTVVNFTDIQMAIYEKCPHDELTIIMRRYMMKIAEDLAKKRNSQALITGESLGQVASQTIQSLFVTNEVCTLPVFRPLIGFDKQEIINISEKINTYETSILPFEDCCTIFVAKHPVTKPNLKAIKRSEQKLEGVIESLYQEAVSTAESILVGSEKIVS